MSERDKKLLVYLGALIILAAAYFLVGRPFLDKIDQLSAEKSQLEMQLAEKRKALENKDTYEQGIADSEARIQEIIDKFPADNTDEKSIMFASHAEADIPMWFPQMSFATETQSMVDGGEVPSASDAEQEQLEENVAEAEGESGRGDEDDGMEQGSVTESSIGGLIGRDTELGLSFEVEYDDFKKFLEYIRDYEDRIVIKDINITYSEYSDLVTGTTTLSQYAIIGETRQLPDVVTGVEAFGTDNVFKNKDKGGSIIDLLAEIASEFLNKLMGGVNEETMDAYGTDYFIKVNAVTDNTSGVTIGKADDVEGTSYVTDDKNGEEKIVFNVSGDSGEYTVKYGVGDSEYEDTTHRGDDGKIYLRIVSTERASSSDKVSVALYINNSSDVPVVVNIEGDDSEKPRIKIAERNGEVTVNE